MTKLLIFAVYFFGILPAGVLLAKAKPIFRDAFFYLMIFSTCRTSTWMIHFDSWPEWKGASRGFALTITDLLLFVVLGSLIGDRKIKFNWFPRGMGFYFLYFGFALLSIANAAYVYASFFEVQKMVFLYFFMLVCYNMLSTKKNFWPLIYAIVAALGYMMLVALQQKYLHRIYHIAVTFPHRNSMALYCTMFGSLMMGILLNETMTRIQRWVVILGCAFASVMILFSLSRGGLACYGAGLMFTIAASLVINGFTPTRVRITLLIGALLVIPLIIAIPRIIERFETAPVSSKVTRINIAKAAARMADAKFLGVGLNNFCANSGPTKDYSREHFAEVTDETILSSPLGGIVETIYLLTAAECGWITMGLLLLWFLYYYFLNFRNLFAFRHHPCFGIAVGIMGGLTGNYLQSVLEWVLRQYSNIYQLTLIFMIIAVMAQFRPAKPHGAASRNPQA